MPGQEPIVDSKDEQISRMRAEMDELRNQTSDNTTRHLQGLLDKAVDMSFDTNEDVKGLIGLSKKLHGDEGQDGRTKILKDMVQEETMRLLQRRKDAGGRFDPEWFAQESSKAASEVAQRYRAVIGDPDKLGRSPETGTGDNLFQRVEQPEDPKWEAGDQPGDGMAKARTFAEQTLLHLASQEVHGDSKV